MDDHAGGVAPIAPILLFPGTPDPGTAELQLGIAMTGPGTAELQLGIRPSGAPKKAAAPPCRA